MTDRYARQTTLPEIGEPGQERLQNARVVVVGLGALGCPAADLLARAGLGALRLIDRDVVEASNLHRQTLFAEEDVGAAKAHAAAARLRDVNASVTIEPRVSDVSPTAALEAIDGADVVLDCTDNFETRYLLNDAAVSECVALVYAGAIGTHGSVFAIRPGVSACLRCLFPGMPDPGSQPTCESAGVLGAASAAIGALQAAQAIRLLVDPSAEPKLLQIDAWTLECRAIAVAEPRPECPCCGRRHFEFLQGREASEARVLCGRDHPGGAVHVDPARDLAVDLSALVRRLAPIGRFEPRPGLIRGTLDDGTTCTIFEDGRAVFEGTRDEARARALYARVVGS